jgi:NAD(P)-dependent dehydrogenase (short-subunit alcohol dehydrogenase family)
MDSVFAPNLLAGKAALVTGGGSGTGAGIAKLFAHHGAKVALVERIDGGTSLVGAGPFLDMMGL